MKIRIWTALRIVQGVSILKEGHGIWEFRVERSIIGLHMLPGFGTRNKIPGPEENSRPL